MSNTILLIYFILQLIFSFILCFFGYKYIRTLISVYGFIVGFLCCFTLLRPAGLSTFLLYLLSFLAGSTVSGVMYFLYNVAMFITGAGLGIAAGVIICTALNLDLFSTVGLIITASLAIAAGLLSLGYKRLLLILSTACCGALLLSLHGGYLLFNFIHASGPSVWDFASAPGLGQTLLGFFHQYMLYVLGATGILGTAGLITQFKKTGKHKK